MKGKDGNGCPDFTRMYARAHTHTHTHTHTHACMHAYMHTHTRTHTNKHIRLAIPTAQSGITLLWTHLALNPGPLSFTCGHKHGGDYGKKTGGKERGPGKLRWNADIMHVNRIVATSCCVSSAHKHIHACVYGIVIITLT